MTEIIDAYDLKEHSGELVLFQRGDVTLEGRLFYNDERKSEAEYVVVPANGHCRLPISWNKIRSLAVRNRLHDTWDIPVMAGDIVTFDYKKIKEIDLDKIGLEPSVRALFIPTKVLRHELDSSARQYEVRL